MSGILYVVGTPIGNLSDISERALETLEKVDFIAAEDKRVTIKILNHYNIKKPMLSYHEHNRFDMGKEIAARLLEGESCALVTDAGMPAISDPGTELVDLCHNSGVKVASIPGPSAIVTAAAISGLNVSRFSFEGFLSVNKRARKKHLEEIKSEKKTMIFYEAPHKLQYTLQDLFDVLGDRTVAIIKELTKIHENVERTSLARAAEEYKNKPVKGEFVIIIESPLESEDEEITPEEALETACEYARELVADGTSSNEAAKAAAKKFSVKKSDIYYILNKGKD